MEVWREEPVSIRISAALGTNAINQLATSGRTAVTGLRVGKALLNRTIFQYYARAVTDLSRTGYYPLSGAPRKPYLSTVSAVSGVEERHLDRTLFSQPAMEYEAVTWWVAKQAIALKAAFWSAQLRALYRGSLLPRLQKSQSPLRATRRATARIFLHLLTAGPRVPVPGSRWWSACARGPGPNQFVSDVSGLDRSRCKSNNLWSASATEPPGPWQPASILSIEGFPSAVLEQRPTLALEVLLRAAGIAGDDGTPGWCKLSDIGSPAVGQRPNYRVAPVFLCSTGAWS
jgi:hypothetical protein